MAQGCRSSRVSDDPVAAIILASWYQDPDGYDLERLADSAVRIALTGLLSQGQRGTAASREPLAEIRKIDQEIEGFFASQGSEFAHAAKASGRK